MAKQEDKDNNQNNGINVLSGGMAQDISPINNQGNTYTYALNMSNKSSVSEYPGRYNEEGNEGCFEVSPGYNIIGSIYMQDGNTALFLIGQQGQSEIGIANSKDCSYTKYINDEDSQYKLEFNFENPIEGVYKRRKGCEDIIYWVQKGKPPRIFDFSNKRKFLKPNNIDLILKKFNLQNYYDIIPQFEDIVVNNYGGSCISGSYSFAVGYCNDAGNVSYWSSISNPVVIYNDSLNKSFNNISGSLVSEILPLIFPPSNKSISITLNNIDTDFKLYRIAVIAKNSGNGLISQVYLSELLSTNQNKWTYDGSNVFTTMAKEDLMQKLWLMDSANAIEQIENRLVIGNVEEGNKNLCELQKYASMITSDCIVKNINLSSMEDKSNPKNPTHEFNNGIGYMPGEIYSFGIIWVFEDGSESPVFHIPGRNNDASETNVVYSPQTDGSGNNITFPMNNTNNTSLNSIYNNVNTCNTDTYWGVDNKGTSLSGKKVRHHRFPYRSEIGVGFVNSQTNSVSSSTLYYFKSFLSGKLKVPIPCPEENPTCGTDVYNIFKIKIEYTVGGVNYTTEKTINPLDYSNGVDSFIDVYINLNTPYYTESPVFVGMYITDLSDNYIDMDIFSDWGDYFDSGTENHGYSLDDYTNILTSNKYNAKILGIKFSNIEKPKLTGKQVIGYYIVRNERTDSEKTILDSAVMFPTLTRGKYTSSGLLVFDDRSSYKPNANNSIPSVNKKVHSLITLEHKFKNKNISNFDSISQEGLFLPLTSNYSRIWYNDVYDGTSYDSEIHKPKKNDDGATADGNPRSRGLDGWCLQVAVRDNIMQYHDKGTSVYESASPNTPVGGFNLNKNDIKRTYYLDALEDSFDEVNNHFVYNVSSDNKIGIVELNNNLNYHGNQPSSITSCSTDCETCKTNNPRSTDRVPYVYLKKDKADFYLNFQTLPYYKENSKLQLFNNQKNTSVYFNGDVYISPVRYTTSIFNNNRVTLREKKNKDWKIIVAVFLLVAAIAGSVFTFGAAGAALIPAAATLLAGTAVAAAGLGLNMLSSGIKYHNMVKAYGEAYKKGLRAVLTDNWGSYTYGFVKSEINEDGNGVQNATNIPLNNGSNLAVSSGCMYDYWYKADDDSGSLSTHYTGESDDTIEWYADCFTDLWFESTVNANLRNKHSENTIPTFLAAPGIIEQGNNSPLILTKPKDYFYLDMKNPRYPVSILEQHIANKLTVADPTRNDSLKYLGYAGGEYYNVNPDYICGIKERPYFHLPVTYDCCSKCEGVFPHRWRWSEQSFQEDLEDNYKLFLSNNYNDIESNNGEIVNIYRFLDQLFIHTKESLWLVPKNNQERVVGDLISYIGTGDLYSIPPKKIIDDKSGNSAGISYKWGKVITPNGIMFPADKQGDVILFNGKNLQPINSFMNKFFKDNLELHSLKNKSIEDSSLFGNPHFLIGNGYISVFDYKYNRIILTKKDFVPNALFQEEIESLSDYKIKICNDGKISFFNDYTALVNSMKADGYYLIEEYSPDCNLVFKKVWLDNGSYEEDYQELEPELVLNDYMDLFTNNSWTISFDVEENTWISFHSYLPNYYFSANTNHFSSLWKGIGGNNLIWKHNEKLLPQTYYGVKYPFVVEYVINAKGFNSKLVEFIKFNTNVYEEIGESLLLKPNDTFDKVLVYSDEQITGELNIISKNRDLLDDDYLFNQVNNQNPSEIIADRNENLWSINKFKNIRVDYTKPMFLIKPEDLQNSYFTDREVDTSVIDFNKDWFEQEIIRGDFIKVRFSFNNYNNYKMVVNYFINFVNESYR